MKISRYIYLLSVLILLPLFANAQMRRPVTKRQAEQIGKKVYITSSGDTTLVVNPISKGLKTPETEFLFRDSSNPELDSILAEQRSNYSSLEAATLSVNRLLSEMETEQKTSKSSNNALSFRIASKNRNMRKKELEAREISEEVIKKDRSVQELAALYAMFGDRPTYYINGVEVPLSVVSQLYPSEVVGKTMRVADTASGNPNGEVWYSVTEKALKRIKLPVNMAYNASPEVTVYTGVSKDLSSYIKEVEKVQREKNKASLKSQPVIKREITPDGKYIDREVQPSEDTEESRTIDGSTYGTRVISRTINNQKTNTNEVISTENSTPRSSIPVVRRTFEESERTQETTPARQDENNREIEKEEKTPPKRSVRRIKERHQNQYQDDQDTDAETIEEQD